MVVDFHTHVFPDKIAKSTISALAERSNGKPSTDGTVDGLLGHLELSGVDVAISLPVLTKASQFDSVLNFASTINERFLNSGRKIISFAGMHPDCEDVDAKMAKIKSLGIKGIKIHPDYQNTYINDERYVKILKSAKKHDLIVVTHSGVDDGYIGETVKCPPERVLEVIKEVNYDKFVLAHFGAHKQWKDAFEKLAGQNVYFDTAFTLHEIDEKLFKSILEKHGEDRVLFATDCPWRNISEDLSIIKSYNLPQDTLDKLLFKNAKKLLGI